MPRLSDIPPSDSCVTLLLYGNSGTGKTYFIGSSGDRTLIVTPSNGVATLKSALFKSQIGANPFLEEVNEAPIPTRAEAFDKYSDIIDLYLEKHTDEIDTIVVDDATALRRVALNKGLELNNKLGLSKTINKSKEVIVPAVQDYGIEMNLIEQFVREYTTRCKGFGKNFILTAHERLTYDKGDAMGDAPIIRKISPGFTGKTFPDDITGLFDLTWHTEVKGGGDRIFYQIRTQPDSVTVAKTRWGGLFPVLFEKSPRFTDVVNAVKSQTPIKVK